MDKTIVSILAGLGGMFGWGTSDFFANHSSDKIGHFKTFFWSQIAGTLSILFLIPIFDIELNLTFLFIALLLAASLFYAIAYLLFYKAFEIGNVSVVSATINLYVVFTMIFAFVILGQRLSLMQLLAVCIILAGVTLISFNFSDLKNKTAKLLFGVKETLMASLLFGIFWTLLEVITEKTGWLSATIFVKTGSILFLIILSFFAKHKLSLAKIDLKTKIIVVLIGILETAAVASVNYGLTIGDVILITPIASALSLVTILMAVIFLKEKISIIQGIGIFLVISGIILTGF